MKDAEQQAVQSHERSKMNTRRASTNQVKNFFDSDENDEGATDGNPYDTPAIASLYPAVSVMMCDLKGFTSWSSVREPSQVGSAVLSSDIIEFYSTHKCFQFFSAWRRRYSTCWKL